MNKNKTRIVKLDNRQDNPLDRVKSKPKANFEQKVGSELEASSSLVKASPSLNNITSVPNIRKD